MISLFSNARIVYTVLSLILVTNFTFIVNVTCTLIFYSPIYLSIYVFRVLCESNF